MFKEILSSQKKIIISSFVIVLSLCGWVNVAMAQALLPAGGSSFETALRIDPGNYQGGILGKHQEMYYRFQGKSGQEVRIECKFLPEGNFGVLLYNESKEKLVGGDYGQDFELSWLANADNSEHTYYLKIISREWQADSFTLKISLVDYYDADSQTDAGDSFDKALVVSPGSYNGYLAGYPYIISNVGDDIKDYYKVPVKKGVTYKFKLIPPSSDEMNLDLFSLSRELIKQGSSSNAGAIVSFSLTPSSNTYVFLLVSYTPRTGEEIVNYKLSIESSAPLIKFYGCKEETCEFLAEYVSLSECEQDMAMTCYQTSDCDGMCEQTGVSAPKTPGIPKIPGISDLTSPTFSSILPTPWFFIKSFASRWIWLACLSLLFFIVFYVYFALCLQALAKKTNTPNKWLAWIPVANIFLMVSIAKKPLWWFGLLLVPIVNIVVGIILWMAIAERVGKQNWIGLLIILPIVGIVVPGYLAFAGTSKEKKIKTTKPSSGTGTIEANKPVVGYKHACKYCGKLVPPNSSVCPYCGKVNPLGPFRCPKCHEPIEKDWMTCPNCNLNLRIVCPFCGKTTFFSDYCEDCGKRLVVVCPHCGQEQPPISDNCIKCGEPLNLKSNN